MLVYFTFYNNPNVSYLCDTPPTGLEVVLAIGGELAEMEGSSTSTLLLVFGKKCNPAAFREQLFSSRTLSEAFDF